MKADTVVLTVVVVCVLALVVVCAYESVDAYLHPDTFPAWCHELYVERGVTGVTEDAWCNRRDF